MHTTGILSSNPYILCLGTPPMEAHKSRLIDLLAGNHQFIVPIYQRTYNWDKEHCRQLYDDIVQAGLSDSDSTHFLGAITFYTPTQPYVGTRRHQLIDGQQRITTFMLLLAALNRELRDQIPQPTPINQWCNTVDSDSDEYLKMKLSQDDNSVFEEILKNGQTTRSGTVRANYELFCKWVLEDQPSNNFKVIWKGIQKLTIVYIVTNDQDNAQRIFESMNSTGLNLSTTDLVQNYLLMQGDSNWQQKVYTKYWHPLEELFDDNRENFDGYLHCYLTMKQRHHIMKKKLYKKFKEYAEQRAKDVLPDLYQYAKYYACLLYPKEYNSSSKKLNKLIKHIHDQNTDVVYPLLLKILSDYESRIISEDDAIELFTFVDSYLFRCTITRTAKNLNQAIPVIMSKLDESNYVNSIKDAVLERTGRDRFPEDPVFKQAFMEKEFYHKDRLSRYVLDRLTEKYQGSSVLTLSEYQIEHIMPQTLSDEWKKTLGGDCEEIHNLCRRKIGNLTLTEENQVLGNNSFAEKQKIYAGSVVKMTSALGTDYNQWTKTEINHRSERLAEDAIGVWKYPVGRSPNPRPGIDDEELEQDHLYGRNVTALWADLKKSILTQFPDAKFEMWQKYANFKIFNSASRKPSLICSIQALKYKIYVVYNTRLSDGIIEISDFVRDVSKVGHLGTGDLRSEIYSNDDIPKAITLIQQVVQKLAR